jgi:hypothetical protein
VLNLEYSLWHQVDGVIYYSAAESCYVIYRSLALFVPLMSTRQWLRRRRRLRLWKSKTLYMLLAPPEGMFAHCNILCSALCSRSIVVICMHWNRRRCARLLSPNCRPGQGEGIIQSVERLLWGVTGDGGVWWSPPRAALCHHERSEEPSRRTSPSASPPH